MGEFWTAKRKRFWAVGVVLIGLAAATVVTLYVVESSPPKDLPRSAANGELSAYLSDEFKAVSREGTRLEQKLPVTDPAQISESLHNWIGQAITVEELFPGGGIRVLGTGPAAVPGPGKSVHLKLAVEGDKGGVAKSELSLLIQMYRQMPVLDDKGAYTLPGRGLGVDAPPITVWRRGGLVCYLVSNTKSGMAALRQALGASEPNKPY